MANHLPYLGTAGSLGTALDKIKEAQTPERFTRDFLHTVLNMKGGSSTAVVPYLKKVGFLNSDGTPTQLYEQFRNPKTSGTAAAAALRKGYDRLYSANEYAHELSDADLRGLVVQVTGAEKGSSAVKQTVRTFKKLREYADFDADAVTGDSEEPSLGQATLQTSRETAAGDGVTLAYTINLHLPPSTNVEVFNAIFKSLREHLLED